MHHLGVPTSRAVSLVGSPLQVRREEIETAAVVLRLAPSWIRFGTFELHVMRRQYTLLKKLVEFAISVHFPQYGGKDLAESVPAMYKEVVARTAALMARWQAVGFAHGVMNTDNFSLLGVTIDYGPFGFLDQYDPTHICNHSDEEGRYAFYKQPEIGKWNLARLADVLQPFMPREVGHHILESSYQQSFQHVYNELMRAKLGLHAEQSLDASLVEELLRLMAEAEVDYTNCFRQLSHIPLDATVAGAAEEEAKLLSRFSNKAEDFRKWLEKYRQRLRSQLETLPDKDRLQQMQQTNPKFILRNYLAQDAIEAAQKGDFSEVNRLLQLLRRPFDEHAELQRYAQDAPAHARHIVCSCSS